MTLTREAVIKILSTFAEINERREPPIVIESVKVAVSELENVDRITMERNAAIEQLRGRCEVCKHYRTIHCVLTNCTRDKWEWVGIDDT